MNEHIYIPKNFYKIIIFFFLVGILVLSPPDPFNLKLPLLALTLLLNVNTILSGVVTRVYNVEVIMGILFPMCCVFQTIILGGDASIAISRSYVSVFLLLVIIENVGGYKYKSYLITLLKVESIIILLVVGLDLAGIQPVNGGQFSNLLYELGVAGSIKLSNFITQYKIVAYSAPLLIFLVDEMWKSGKRTWLIIAAISMILTGTRANWLALAMYIFYQVYFGTIGKKKYAKVVQGFAKFIIAIVLIVFSMNIVSTISSIMNSSYAMNSESIKLAQISNLLGELKNPETLLFGKGLGVAALDPQRNIYTNEIEMEFFYYLYEIGLLLFIPFVIFLFSPLILKMDKGKKISYVCFLVSALTNPFLLSSTAYVAYVYIYDDIKKTKLERQKDE